MILAIDIGNTNIVFALYQDNGIEIFNIRHSTEYKKTKDEYGIFLLNFLSSNNINLVDIKGVIIASVVPQLNYVFRSMSINHLGHTPLFIGDDSVKVNLDIKINNPHTLGADRVASSIGAIKKYEGKIILVDCGTATTFDVIGDRNDFIGGVIAPGVMTSIKSLHESTSLLPLFDIKKPSRVVAKTLGDALHAGIFYGSIGMIERIIAEVKASLPGGGNGYKVVAIGGLAKIFEGHVSSIDVFDETLTMFGLFEVYNFNKK